MSENAPVTKIYCDDRNGGNDAMLAAMLAGDRGRRGDNDMAAAMWMNNNPMMYLVWAMMMRWMNGNGWDGNGNGQLATIQNQLQDNHNNDLVMQGLNSNLGAVRELATRWGCDFNMLNSAICAVREAVSTVAGQVGFSAERVINAANMGDANIIQALNSCCCSTQRQIADFRGDMQLQICKQTNTLERGLDFVNRSVERGFATMGYETKSQTCELINNQNQNTQRIIDTLNSHWTAEDKLRIQDLKFENSQLKQNALLINAIRGGGCACGTSCN